MSSSAKTSSMQVFKTKLCRFYVEMRCTKGSECTFAHSDEEMRCSPDLQKTKLCADWRQHGCNNPRCTYAHGEEELNRDDRGFRTSMCSTFKVGTCTVVNCQYAHSEEELRTPLRYADKKLASTGYQGNKRSGSRSKLKSKSNVRSRPSFSSMGSQRRNQSFSSVEFSTRSGGSRSSIDEYLGELSVECPHAPSLKPLSIEFPSEHINYLPPLSNPMPHPWEDEMSDNDIELLSATSIPDLPQDLCCPDESHSLFRMLSSAEENQVDPSSTPTPSNMTHTSIVCTSDNVLHRMAMVSPSLDARKALCGTAPSPLHLPGPCAPILSPLQLPIASENPSPNHFRLDEVMPQLPLAADVMPRMTPHLDEIKSMASNGYCTCTKPSEPRPDCLCKVLQDALPARYED